MSTHSEFSQNGLEIAIIGMVGRFPGAKNIEEFWQNLQNSVESITTFTDEELISSGIDPTLVNNPQYVKSGGILKDIEFFDASFFGFNPREAEITDPQQRLFLECAWQALESAGYDSQNYQGLIGVYAGSGMNSYMFNLYSNQNIRNSIDNYQLILASDKDFLTTRVSYKLELEGPSVDIQTACSTSLVAVHFACRSLLGGECDIALAGGVAISTSQKSGYLYQQGGILSPDGHCRAFDAQAQGIASGNGVGIVVLKRLEDALADGDCIHAVIKGSAINNDGAIKVSYTAPRIDTQAKVIRTAQTIAEVDAETISYIEAHGTGTPLGDPIEIAALTQAFRATTDNKGFCAIGSVKTNIGHLDAAAGVTGLIKTVLALKHRQIPASLHFQQPNPQIDFDNSPFYVNTTLSQWKTNSTPRRAGVSSFGIGGTNAHVIVEQAPPTVVSSPSRPWQLLLLCAKTDSALETVTTNLVTHLKQHPDLNLADVGYTLQVGRRAFEHRRMLVCDNFDDAVTVLENLDPQRIFTNFQQPCNRETVFMFPGQGSQYVSMGRELYDTEPIFRKHVDECCEVLKPHLGVDLRSILYPDEQKIEVAAQQLQQTHITQPAIFVIEYALAQLWMAWGIFPVAMIGHSIGEYVAATLAGIFSLEDALALVATRGRLMQQIPSGAMLSVALSEEAIQSCLEENLCLASLNAPSSCVVSGSEEAIELLQEQLQPAGVRCRRLHTSHAFHSQMMEPVIETFTQSLQLVKLNPPKIPFVSNVSGTWITATQATDPNYWANHLRQPVRFSQGVTELLKQPQRILLEVGPGRTLSSLAKQHQADVITLTSIRHPQEKQSDVAFLLNTLGKLWLMGVEIDWSGFYVDQRRHRLPLPTYPFERQPYWIEPQPNVTLAMMSQKTLDKKTDIADWFYVPRWKESTPIELFKKEKLVEQKSCWLVFVDATGVGSQIAKKLDTEGHEVVTVTVGQQFTKLGNCVYAINPQVKNDYDILLKELSILGLIPNAIAHFWSLNPNPQGKSPHQFFEECQNNGFYSLLFLAQALGKQQITDALQILMVTNNVQEVNGDENLYPEKATVIGICKVIPQEYPNITCRNIDVVIPESGTFQENQLIDQLLAEFTQTASEKMVVYRGKHRWVQIFEPVQLEEPDRQTIPIREGGVYLITGGLGGIGLVVAEYLAQTVRAKLILTGRSSLPSKQDWSQWLTTHDENDDISRKIHKVQILEALGAEVLVESANVADEEQMQALMAQALNRFGQIHGVIHAAGIKLFNTVQQISKTECENQLRSTGYGLFVLENVLQGKELDFCVIISSLASVLGVIGMAAYPAAHIFTDAFVHKHNQKSLVPWLSINYDNWKTQESSESLTLPKGADSAIMTQQEGLETFKRALSKSKFTQIVTSTVDLQASIRKWIKLEFRKDSQLPEKASSSSFYSRPNLHNAYFAPRNEVEQTIANIWQKLLGIDLVGIHDNFFELGGDSILGIQVIARAAQAGFHITPQQLFEYQTIAELAEIASTTQVIQAEQGLVTGLLPLAPIQHWFFEQNQPQVHHWNQAVLLEVLQVIDPALLEQALQQLLIHHDALRLRFTPSESGWQQVNASPEQMVPFTQIDLSALSREVQRFAMEATAAQIQASLNLSTGPIMRVVLFELGANFSSRMLIVIHHLVVDFGSWRILLEDFQKAYQQLNQGKAIQLPQKTTSFKYWSFQLKEYAQSAKLYKKQDYWLSGLHKQVSRLPIDFPEGINTVVSSQTVSVVLSEKETQALLQEVSFVYRTNTQEVLLTALVQAFGQWTGGNSLLVDIEGNGRDATIENVDISRTVGWFTTIYPVVLDLEKVDSPGDALKVVKEQVRCIDNEGIDYGVLHYLNQDTVLTKKIRSIPKAEVIFLYLGQFGRSLPQDYLFRPTREFSGIEHSPQGTRSHLLEVTASVNEGQLRVDLSYSTNLHRHQTIKELSHNFVETLKSLITYCQSKDVGGYTPSDFSAAKISQESLNRLLAEAGQSERGYPE